VQDQEDCEREQVDAPVQAGGESQGAPDAAVERSLHVGLRDGSCGDSGHDPASGRVAAEGSSEEVICQLAEPSVKDQEDCEREQADVSVEPHCELYPTADASLEACARDGDLSPVHGSSSPSRGPRISPTGTDKDLASPATGASSDVASAEKLAIVVEAEGDAAIAASPPRLFEVAGKLFAEEEPLLQGQKRSRTPEAIVDDHLPAGLTRPVRQRMRPLEPWRNERVLYERKPGSLLPTVAAVVVPLTAASPRARRASRGEAAKPEATASSKRKQDPEKAQAQRTTTPKTGKKAGRKASASEAAVKSPERRKRGRPPKVDASKVEAVASPVRKKRGCPPQVDASKLEASDTGVDTCQAKLRSEKQGRQTGPSQPKPPQTPQASRRTLQASKKVGNSLDLETPRVPKRIAPVIVVPTKQKDCAPVGGGVWGPSLGLPRAAARRSAAGRGAEETKLGTTARSSLAAKPKPASPQLTLATAACADSARPKESASPCPQVQPVPSRSPAPCSLMAAIEAARMQSPARLPDRLESLEERQRSSSRGPPSQGHTRQRSA